METGTPRGPDEGELLEPTQAMPAIVTPVEPTTPVEGEVTLEHVPLPRPRPAPPVTPAVPIAAPASAYVFGNPLVYAIRRGLALAIDVVLVTCALVGIFYGQISINPLTGLPAGSEAAFDATLGTAAGAAVVYVILAQAIFGTTLGKLLLGLHVYAKRGRFVGLGRGFIRTLLLPIDLVLIGIVLALLPGHRRLGDLFGGTVVARSPLRGFSPVLGALGIAVVAAAPFLLGGGTERVFATLGAFVAFGPSLLAHAAAAVFALGGLAGAPPAAPVPLPTV